MANRLTGKSALITGGASGLGAACARAFVAQGATVTLADIDHEKGQALAQELGDGVQFVGLDVTDEQGWHDALKAHHDAFGALSILVHSAGISIPSSIEDATFDHWRQIQSTNLDGTFLALKAGVEAMKNKGGSIITMGSTLGRKAASPFPAYGASKAAISQLSRSVALHCAEQKYGIRVNCVLPGAIHTEMFEAFIEQGVAMGASREQVIETFAAGHPLGRVGQPDEVAMACVYLASDEASYITGTDHRVDGGYCI